MTYPLDPEPITAEEIFVNQDGGFVIADKISGLVIK
jgi:hypothetical protein